MKNVFSYNNDINKNAYMNWRTSSRNLTDSMVELAKGFMESALELSQTCVNDNRNKRADILIFPILFNANHGIEVYLKAICWTLNQLLETNKDFAKHHKLVDLLKDTSKLMESHEDHEASTHFLERATAYINELYDKIGIPQPDGTKGSPDIAFTRYVLDQKGRPQFYIMETDNVVVDLENFIKIIQNINDDLDNMYTYLSVQLTSQEES